MRVAFYARGKDAAEIERQRDALVTWANANGHTIVQEYADLSLEPERREFERLVADAKSSPRPFDAIAFTTWSRLSRSASEVASVRDLGLDLLAVAP